MLRDARMSLHTGYGCEVAIAGIHICDPRLDRSLDRSVGATNSVPQPRVATLKLCACIAAQDA